jgi:hypothetical protein
VKVLAPLTTGTIARRLQAALPAIGNPAVRAFIAAGADAIRVTAEQRNHVAHAGPATIGGKQRLHRWTNGGKIAFTIDDAWLDKQIADLDERTLRLSPLREPARRAANLSPSSLAP